MVEFAVKPVPVMLTGVPPAGDPAFGVTFTTVGPYVNRSAGLGAVVPDELVTETNTWYWDPLSGGMVAVTLAPPPVTVPVVATEPKLTVTFAAPTNGVPDLAVTVICCPVAGRAAAELGVIV
jgi:hypothetical protein